MKNCTDCKHARWQRTAGGKLHPSDDGSYADDHTQRHWWTWQQATRNERERIKAALNAMLHCPCCDTTDVCDDECTFAADCPHESQSMQYLRDALTGA